MASFSWQRVASVARKELLHVLRDPATIFFALMIPVVEMFMLGYAIDTNVRHIPTVLYDAARTQESRSLIRMFENSDDFDIVAQTVDEAELYRAVVAGRARVAIKIPEDYSRRLLAGQTAQVLLQVDDGSQQPLLPCAIAYEAALAGASPDRPAVAWSPDDLYILYTGGTTGRPKGVLWRQADIYVAALGGRRPDGREVASLDEVVERAERGGLKYMPTAPFMHAAHWVAFDALHGGHTVVLQDETRRLEVRLGRLRKNLSVDWR